MDKRREHLQQLSREELIESHLLLEKRVRTLEKQVADLKTLLQGDPPKPPKTSANSSVPPSRDEKANVEGKAKKKRGPKVGHEGTSRRRVEPDEVIEYRVTECACCGEDLSSHPQHEAGRRQQIDIPPIKLIVRDIVRYGCYCPACDTYQRAEAPPEGQTRGMFGPNLEQLVLYLHYAHPLSYERVQRILADQYGVSLGIGTLVNIVNRAQARLESTAERIREQVQQADVIGSDETGARVDGVSQWQWVFQTPELAYFTIVPSRASKVIIDVLDDAQPQVWISDLLSSQMCHPAEAYQLCLAHQVRDLQYVMDRYRCSWASDMQTLFYDVMTLTQQRHADDFQLQARDLHERLDRLLDTYPVNEDSQRLWRRYHKHRQALLLCLEREDVPPTNNASEQALRNSVIYRKVTGGFRTDWGAQVYANIISILETARRQGQNIADTLVAILASEPAFSWQPE